MHILIITFQLNGLSVESYERLCSEVAPMFASLPGLMSKVWLADPEANTFGGMYLWESREAMQHYLESPVFQGMGTNAHFENVSVRSFRSLNEATAMTAGPLIDVVRRPA